MTTHALNYEVMIADLKQVADKFISVNHFKVKNAEVILQISDSQEINARVYLSASDQYIVRLYRGVLESCLSFVEDTVDSYYPLVAAQTHLDRETFLRATCSCVTEYMFLHEYCHVIRGHINYRDFRKPLWVERPELELQDIRFLECDADIYAANFLFARTYSVFKDPKVAIRLCDLMQCYVVGIRSMFEMLYRVSEVEDLLHEESEHPHSLVRAYIAVCMGVSGPVSECLDEDAEECRALAMRELLSYEAFLYKDRPIDPGFLQSNFERELNIWTTREQDLVFFNLLKVQKVSIFTQAREWLRRSKRFTRDSKIQTQP